MAGAKGGVRALACTGQLRCGGPAEAEPHGARVMSALRRAGGNQPHAGVALQRAAYAKTRPLLGVEPLPLLADYQQVFAEYEVWLAESAGALDGVLILEPRADDLLIWSVAVAPAAQGRGVGNAMLAFAETRARALGRSCIRLYTGAPLVS